MFWLLGTFLSATLQLGPTWLYNLPQTVSKAQEQPHASVEDILYVNFNIMLVK